MYIEIQNEVICLDGLRLGRLASDGSLHLEWPDGRVRRLGPADGAAAAWAAIRGLAAAPVAPPPVDQLGPAVLATIATLRDLADDAAPSRLSDQISAVADRLVRAANEAAAAAGE